MATTGGGTGTVSADDTDVFGNRVENVKVESGKSYTGDYLSGTNVTITAKAEDENVFLGAYVNDKFCSAADESYFSEENGTYTLSLTLTAAEYVQLIFSKKATVTYDPNGGMYNGTEQNTEITMAAIADSNGYAEWKNLSDAEPINKDRVKFIGWYFARAKEDGALIKSDHTVTYDANNTVDDTSDDKLKVEYTEYSSSDACVSSVSADTGLTFVAQWEYLQEVVAMTKKTGEATYKKSNVGGTVSMEIQKSVDYRSTVDFSDSSQGYARLNDTVVLTAKVADSATNADTDKYVFMGWYDEDGNVLSRSNTYTYSVTDYKTVYAHFSASIVYPYLSFVSEKQEPDTDVEMFKKSHVRVGDEYVWQNDLFNGGNGLYGNTIATGFTLQTKGESGKSFDRCMWTITIPSGGTYIKIPENSDKDAYSFYVGESPVLTDEDVKVNKGSIYEVTGVKEEGAQLSLIDGFFDVAVDEDEEEGAVLFDVTQAEETPTFDESNTAVYADEITGVIKVRMLDKLPTVLTGGSVIMYGIVIDNLYSPGASAVFELTTSDTAAEGDMIDITADNNSIIHADSSEEYQNSAGNGYSSVKK